MLMKCIYVCEVFIFLKPHVKSGLPCQRAALVLLRWSSLEEQRGSMKAVVIYQLPFGDDGPKYSIPDIW